MFPAMKPTDTERKKQQDLISGTTSSTPATSSDDPPAPSVQPSPARNIAVCALLATKLAHVQPPKLSSRDGTPVAVFPDGTEVLGDHNIARHVARQHVHTHLYGANKTDEPRVDRWLNFASHALTQDHLTTLNSVLTLRTFFIGTHVPSLADIAVWDALHAQPELIKFIEQHAKKVPHLARWLRYLDSLKDFSDVQRKNKPAKPAVAQTSKAAAAVQGEKKPSRKAGEVSGPQDVRTYLCIVAMIYIMNDATLSSEFVMLNAI